MPQEVGPDVWGGSNEEGGALFLQENMVGVISTGEGWKELKVTLNVEIGGVVLLGWGSSSETHATKVFIVVEVLQFFAAIQVEGDFWKKQVRWIVVIV